MIKDQHINIFLITWKEYKLKIKDREGQSMGIYCVVNNGLKSKESYLKTDNTIKSQNFKFWDEGHY